MVNRLLGRYIALVDFYAHNFEEDEEALYIVHSVVWASVGHTMHTVKNG